MAAPLLLIHSAWTKAAAPLFPFLIKILAYVMMTSVSFFLFSNSLLLLLLLPDLLGTHQLSPYDLNQQHIMSKNNCLSSRVHLLFDLTWSNHIRFM